MGHLQQQDSEWLEQQVAIRSQSLRGFLTDLRMLWYFPQNRSPYFNEEILRTEIRYQVKCLREIQKELQRREIP